MTYKYELHNYIRVTRGYCLIAQNHVEKFNVLRCDKKTTIIVAAELKNFKYLKYAAKSCMLLFKDQPRTLSGNELKRYLLYNELYSKYDGNKKCFKKKIEEFIHRKSRRKFRRRLFNI